MGKMIIENLHNDFGARVLNCDVSSALDEDRIRTILKAIDDFSFIIFPNQSLSDESHLKFT